MLKKETISPDLDRVLSKLMQIESLSNFRLVGGTALALQTGHRKSIDIDLFSDTKNDYGRIFNDLKKSVGKEINSGDYVKQGLSLIIANIKVDIYDWNTRFIRDAVTENNWRLTHKDDIAAMKLDTLCSANPRYERKDFVDIACLLNEYSLEKMIELYFIKYNETLLNDRLILEKLGRLSRAETSPMPVMLNGQNWDNTLSVINKSIDDYMRSKGL